MNKVRSFGFLIFALVISVLAVVILYLHRFGEIPELVVIFLSLAIVITISANVIIKRFLPNSDSLIFPIVVLLNGIGLMQITRIDFTMEKIWGEEYSYAIRSQLLFSLLGVVVLVALVATIRDHRKLRRLIYTSMFFGIFCIILPLVPGLGVETNGASVWIKLGPFGTLQPAEFAKLFLAIFFAGYLTVNRERLQSAGKRILGLQLPRAQDLGPILVVWLISLAVLIFQHDLGTSLLFFGIFIAMLYIATGKVSWAIIGVALFMFGAFLASKAFAHVAARIAVWQDPFNPEIYNRAVGGSGQVVQGFFALASGGLFGQGIDQGYPGLTPFANSDLIYSALGEELGLTGLLAILVLFLLLIERAISISLNTKDGFGKLLTAGIGFSFVLQVFTVVGGVTGVIPLTGLTLPFISRGGSSIIANYMIVGVLLLISNGVYGKIGAGKSRPDASFGTSLPGVRKRKEELTPSR